MKMVITRGLPASGKSTFAKAWVAEDSEHRVRVNRDNLRWTLGIKTGVGTYEQENEVTYWQDEMIRRAFSLNKDVVVDNTNLRAKSVKSLLKIAQEHSAEVEFADFVIEPMEAIRRDVWRKVTNQRSVGSDVINNMASKFVGKNGELPPIPIIESVQPLVFEPYTRQPGLPYAIICDIDGTLAHMEGRSPYDPTLYHTDSFDAVIGLLSTQYAVANQRRIIVVSGRSAQYRAETEAWLMDQHYVYDELYMRPEGDQRNDAIVKNELFENHIAGRFNIDFVLDDRDRVINMWRAKGLKALQVAAGNF